MGTAHSNPKPSADDELLDRLLAAAPAAVQSVFGLVPAINEIVVGEPEPWETPEYAMDIAGFACTARRTRLPSRRVVLPEWVAAALVDWHESGDDEPSEDAKERAALGLCVLLHECIHALVPSARETGYRAVLDEGFCELAAWAFTGAFIDRLVVTIPSLVDLRSWLPFDPQYFRPQAEVARSLTNDLSDATGIPANHLLLVLTRHGFGPGCDGFHHWCRLQCDGYRVPAADSELRARFEAAVAELLATVLDEIPAATEGWDRLSGDERAELVVRPALAVEEGIWAVRAEVLPGYRPTVLHGAHVTAVGPREDVAPTVATGAGAD